MVKWCHSKMRMTMAHLFQQNAVDHQNIKHSIPPKDVEVCTSFPTKHYGSLRPRVIDNHSDVEGQAKDDNETGSEVHEGDCSDD